MALLRSGDYVSPGLRVVVPDMFFPNMIVGQPERVTWPFFRGDIPHNWYVDQRGPDYGFLSRDEALLLHNIALQFRGRRALEIGCWMGWSACHLVLAGLHLDVIDPLLSRSPNRESVVHSLAMAMEACASKSSVTLVPGSSPAAVDSLGSQGSKWALFFIDGDHEGSHPLEDAQVCEKYAEADAAILFHDLTSPDVALALDYLRQLGWQTLLYNTMQIFGMAWRGNVQPVAHHPDPDVFWTLPEHLKSHAVSNWSSADVDRDFAELLPIIKPFTLLSTARLYSLYRHAKAVCQNDLPGAFVECGCYRGGVAALLAAVVSRFSRRARRVWAFDTFAGMPEPGELDRHAGVHANETPWGGGTLAAPVDQNLAVICRKLQVTALVRPVAGLFTETLPAAREAVGDIALLHADADWYASTLDILDNLYDQVVTDGVIQIDDYGHWEGCRRAVDEFLQRRQLPFSLRRIDETGVWFAKG